MGFPSLLIVGLGVSLIAVSSSQFIAQGLETRRSIRREQRSRRSDLRALQQSAEVARLNSSLLREDSPQTLPWRVMEVAEVADESLDCRSFYLVDPYRQPLPEFFPGQYLMVRPALAGAQSTTRCYSLSSSPDNRYWRITVKRQPVESESGRRTRAGGLSAWLHDAVGVGDCLLVGGPSGQFHLAADNPRPLVLLAAGVGITPMASMLRWSLERTPNRPVTLLYQAQDSEHWPLGRSLHSWQSGSNPCRIKSFFSRMDASALQGLSRQFKGEFAIGKFNCQDVLDARFEPACDYYMCGPNDWMDSLRLGLIDAGVAADQIHWESFGASPDLAPAMADDHGTTQSVRFDHSDVDALWQGSEQTLWELAREHGIDIPSGCLSGVCGCCRIKLLSGSVEYDRPVGVELTDDECLPCIARPRDSVILDA